MSAPMIRDTPTHAAVAPPVTRPVLRYHGGKFRLAPWLMRFFPAHRVYVEPFGGGAIVLLRKAPVPCEVYNDLDGRIVSLFQVLRDPDQAAELLRLLQLTPYARAEHQLSYEPSADAIEQARRTIVRSMMGHGTAGAIRVSPTGFRRLAGRSNQSFAAEWARYSEELRHVVARLRQVIIECRPASDVLTQYDAPDCLHYVDPPYPHTTRRCTSNSDGYAHELSDDDHRALAPVLRSLTGYVVLSGYPCALYDQELYPDWERHTTETMSDGGARTEVVWLNPACSAALARQQTQGRFAL